MTFKRRVLSALGKEDLIELGRSLELSVTTRMSVDELRDALARSKRASIGAIVQASLSRDSLKDICRACGLDDVGNEKQVLVERILAAGQPTPRPYRIDPEAAKGSVARDARAPLAPVIDIPGIATRPSPQVKGKGKPRRRAGVPESEAMVSGSLKAALRQFALGAAGGYRGRDAHVSFTTHLLECFGWPDGRPPGAEIPQLFTVADGGQRVEREVALWWPERRALIDVAPHDAVLSFAWKDLLRVCLQLTPAPQYVVLTNQRDVQLYDLARDREAPRLSIPLDDLSKYSEAFPFLATDWVPGTTPRIVNVEKVSAEVADLVAKLYRSVRAQHPTRERDVIRFTLQCITAMFAEDIGLLPKNYFTALLYEGGKRGDVERRLHDLFVQMNDRDLPAPRVVPYFNGGLFTDASTLPLGSEQIVALTKAAEANWTFVDPHIFGSVFQGIMDDAERHASGAHYTAHDDIMRVVGPTIVEPWRRRIQAATSLKELTELRAELFKYRVLDPACGSGNFLYVAFRELYRLDTELLSRMREFRSTHEKIQWSSGLYTTSFFGIDVNLFAVELAKVTLNIAKKIAFEERKAAAFELLGQVEMDADPSLPLDNLDENIVCADALFTDWPTVDAIIGNPPFLGGLKIRSELGPSYLAQLQTRFPGVNGRADLCAFWFRRAHDHLRQGGRAGLVATNTIREGNTREAATDYVLQNGGTIVNAVSSQPWPGIALVNVSMVNWIKGTGDGEPRRLIIDGAVYEPSTIPPTLQLAVDLGGATKLAANGHGTSQGLVLGTKEFQFSGSVARELWSDEKARPFVRPILVASHLLSGRLAEDPEYVVDMSGCETEAQAKRGGAAYDYVRRHVHPVVSSKAATTSVEHYRHWLRTWWRPMWPRADFLAESEKLPRIVVCSRHAARAIYVFASREFFPTESLQLFAFADDYSFGIIQSTFHWRWAAAVGSKIVERIRYTSEVWETFPWPQEPSDEHVAAVAHAARELRHARDELMRDNGWSLRDLHQAADVEGPHPLKAAQGALDRAVADAYGVASDQAPLEFLLELNQLVAEDEALGREVRGPGLPQRLDPKDPRWFSTDCIEPPPLEP
ncbi:MAG TPA: DNA methyltransferase [Kofleriaceae bacterium]|nr:DNA methyltransferase [Kofleriaceae bacterium]